MPDISQRLRPYVDQVLVLSRSPAEARKRNDLSAAVKAGRSLMKEVREGIEWRLSALLRAALLEDVSAGTFFADLDELTAARTQLEGPLNYIEAALAVREGRRQLARAKLDATLFDCPPSMSIDGFSTLAEIHKAGDLRTHYHAARGVLFSLDGEQQNLGVATLEFREAVGLAPKNVLALFGQALLLEETGEAAGAITGHLEVVALGVHVRDPLVGRSYAKLQRHVDRAESTDEIAEFLGSVLEGAAAYEAMHGELLRRGFRNPVVDDAGREALAKLLLPIINRYAKPGERVKDAFDRRLLASNGAHLTAMVELLCAGTIEQAGEAVGAGNIGSVRTGRPEELSLAVAARTLAHLWQSRMNRVLSGENQYPSLIDRMSDLVRCQDRVVHWLSEAVQSNVETDDYYALDLNDLLTFLGRMYATVNDDPVDEDSLVSLIPSEDLRQGIAPAIKVMFHHLKRTGRSWEELEALERLDEICLSVGVGLKMTQFAIGEMGANTYEHLLRTGSLGEQLHAHLHLARLYLDQHRYELAVDHGRKAVELDAKSAEALYNLGLIYLRASKRLLGIESLRDAAERFQHPLANVALAEDCIRDDQPHLAANHYIAAMEGLLGATRPLGSKDLDQIQDWLRRARTCNDDVEAFPIVIDKSLPRKERKQRKKEIEATNAQRLVDQHAREEKLHSLTERFKRMKVRVFGGG